MAETKGIFLIRHIGKTTYKVRVHLSETANETMEDKILRLIRNDGLAMSETANETMEDKILRLIRNDGLAMDGECGIMELPQMSRQSERSA